MENNTLMLPAIALRNDKIPFPSVDLRMDVGRELSVNALNEAENMYGGNIILCVQKNDKDEITAENIYEIGAIAKIVLKIKLPNGNYRVKLSVKNRVRIINFESTNPYLVASYEKVESIDNSDTERLIKKILTEVNQAGFRSFNEHENLLRAISKELNASDMLDTIAYHLKSDDSKYNIFSELNTTERAKLILTAINYNVEAGEIDKKIDEEVRKSMDEAQKEYYLREKMRAIQKELGAKARQEVEIENLREKIEKSGMPDNIREVALKELNLYSLMTAQNAESGSVRNYLDLLVNLPWNTFSKDTDDLKEVEARLDKNHYGLTKIKERIVEYIAVRMMTGKNPSTILCFAGPPGVGKTSLAKSIAEALGRKFIKQSLGGVRDESEIRGHRRTYLGALPGRIIKGMRNAGTVNPVFLLDEIDKMTSDYRGDPAAAMLEVLDPEQNKNFSDNYLEEPYDLSQVMFITTANSLQDIPEPLRDRMEIIELSNYTEYEKFNIAVKHLIPKEIEAHGLSADQLTITDEAIYKIIQAYTREAGVRELDRMIAKICRKAVTLVLIDKVDKVEVNLDNLRDFLGKYRFFNNEGREQGQVGIVTGLAYTQFGGDTLDIEVTTYPGKGMIRLTGKLGDVMKESAETALSYVKSHAKEFGIETQFDTIDIHIHVPEGAVPKDGPSAGVTLTTAIVSALSNRRVPANIGMTGEVTLRGQVLPIGGLREKSIAAVRTGLKKIYIPFDNERDLDEVPEEVKKVLEIVPVKLVTDIINDIFQ